MTERNLVPGFALEGTTTYPQERAGDQDIISATFPLTASTVVAKGQVLALTSAGKLVAVDTAASDGTQIARCISIEAHASGAERNIGVYIGGYFNHAELTWPAAWDTLAERKAAFLGTQINIGSIPAIRAPG